MKTDKTGIPFTCPIIDEVLRDLREAQRCIGAVQKYKDEPSAVDSEADRAYMCLWGLEGKLEEIRKHNEALRDAALKSIEMEEAV